MRNTALSIPTERFASCPIFGYYRDTGIASGQAIRRDTGEGRDDLAEFLTTQDRGVFWLQAPAHVGKTTFAQGFAEAERGDESRFEPGHGGKVVAYCCRKEYRTGLPGMIGTLHDKLQAAYHVS
jgi:hypothetical protein